MNLPKSKRLRFTIAGFVLNFITVGVGMYFKTELVSLGTCLMMVNTPLYAYILGESWNPSKEDKDGK